jgi:hypothetical protein
MGEDRLTPSGATQYQLSSKGLLDQLGIPESGAIGITAGYLPLSMLESNGVPNPASLAATQLITKVVGTPQGATGLSTATPIHATTLAGYSAAGLAYTYMFKGAANVQEDVLAARGTDVYVIELDVAPSMRAQGEMAFNAVLHSWAWAS